MSAPCAAARNGVLCSRRKRRMEEMAMLSANARSELVGTRELENEDEKRYTAALPNGCHPRADTMDTSPTSAAIGIAVRQASGAFMGW